MWPLVWQGIVLFFFLANLFERISLSVHSDTLSIRNCGSQVGSKGRKTARRTTPL